MKQDWLINRLDGEIVSEVAQKQQVKAMVNFILKHGHDQDLAMLDATSTYFPRHFAEAYEYVRSNHDADRRERLAEKMRKKYEKKQKRLHDEFVNYMAALSRGEKPKPMSAALQAAIEKSNAEWCADVEAKRKAWRERKELGQNGEQS